MWRLKTNQLFVSTSICIGDHSTEHLLIYEWSVVWSSIGSMTSNDRRYWTCSMKLYCMAMAHIQCESKKSPLRFSGIFPNGWEFLINYLHTYYTLQSILDYKFLFNYLQLWRSYAILSETTHRFFFTFHWNLTSKFAYWANDVTVDVVSYPTCLLT